MSATALARLDDLASLTGKELLAAIHDGEVPPPAAAELLDLTLHEIHDGRAVFEFRPTPRFDNGKARCTEACSPQLPTSPSVPPSRRSSEPTRRW